MKRGSRREAGPRKRRIEPVRKEERGQRIPMP